MSGCVQLHCQLVWEQSARSGILGLFLQSSLGAGWCGDWKALCWNLAGRRLGEQPHADSYSQQGRFCGSFASFTQPCAQWPHKAHYRLQRTPEGAKSGAGAKEPREPPAPRDRMTQAGEGWDHTNPSLRSPGGCQPWEPALISLPFIQQAPLCPQSPIANDILSTPAGGRLAPKH
uniref:Uncharacterized protein n=1 Tax=Xenopus tropicalis TaxID=8364 RepID=A0A6I8RE86_XENTR